MILIPSILVGLGIVAVTFLVLALVTKSYELLAYSEVIVKVALIICLGLLMYFALGGR